MSTEPETAEPHVRGLSSVGVYNLIAVILFVLTVTEVGILFPPLDAMPDLIKIPLLIGISVAKYAIVVAFFMHLFYDSPLCTFLFGMGMAIAVGTVIAWMHILPTEENPLPVRSPAEVRKSMEGKTSFRDFQSRALCAQARAPRAQA
jgi:cytochrome c oxidase subunit 4